MFVIVLQAMKYLNDLQSERGGKCTKEVLDEDTAGDNVRTVVIEHFRT